MNAKKEAKRLIDTFWKFDDHFPKTTYAHAVICAKLAVDEIIDAINKMEDPTQFVDGEWNSAITLWVEVRKEIEVYGK